MHAVEGALFTKCHTFGKDALKYSSSKKKMGKAWKFFYPDLWETTGCAVSHRWLHGNCSWCSQRNTSLCLQGEFTMHGFRDDNKAYSLQTRGTLDLVAMRPEHSSAYGKAEIDQVYFSCSKLNAALPVGESGVLTLDNFPNFVHPVAPVLKNLDHHPVKTRRKTAVCTKAFYGTGSNTHTIERFVRHYLETWKFDYIIMYELGTTVGVLMQDIIHNSPTLSRYYSEGKLVLIDFRQELQREYGAIAGDMVLLSSKNGQLFVSSDCINRAKSVYTDIEWVLLVDWDEILTIGPYRKFIPESFAAFAEEKSRFLKHKGKSRYEVDVLDLQRHRAPDTSICDECGATETWDQDTWTYHALKFEAPQFLNKSLYTESMNKYAVRITQDGMFPRAWAYGVHVLSKCAFQSDGGLRYLVALHDVYLRHYKCLNRQNCEEDFEKVQVLWPIEFGSGW